MLFSELCDKDVINMKNCKNLGHVYDLDFDKCSGKICKIMVREKNQIWNFFLCEPEYVIPYENICQIGPDIVLVDL